MIKIYNKDEIKNYDIVDNWDFPITELDYLLEEHNNESFVLIDNERLYEIENIEEINDLKEIEDKEGTI